MKLNCTQCQFPIEVLDSGPREVSCPSCGSSFRLEQNRLVEIAHRPPARVGPPLIPVDASEDVTLTFSVTTAKGAIRALARIGPDNEKALTATTRVQELPPTEHLSVSSVASCKFCLPKTVA